MRRFKHVYEDGGLIPSETFAMRASVNGQCLTYLGNAGTSPDGKGRAALKRCDPDDDRQRWHGANRDTAKSGAPCCSGVRAWNTDQCLTGATEGSRGGATTFVCEISGSRHDQMWSLDGEGQIRKKGGGFMGSSCLEADASGTLRVSGCKGGVGLSNSAPWTKHQPEEPVESRLYHKALEGGKG